MFVQARNAFHRSGRDASLGSFGFGFAWASWACLLLSMVFFFLGMGGKKDSDGGMQRGQSTRSTKSFDPGNRRVKDDYS